LPLIKGLEFAEAINHEINQTFRSRSSRSAGQRPISHGAENRMRAGRAVYKRSTLIESIVTSSRMTAAECVFFDTLTADRRIGEQIAI
jgi:hypothetical protein